MGKLFDHDFFKFLIGFLFILVMSFGMFYLLASVSAETEKQQASVQATIK
jgi:hypothetical protein